MKYTTKEMQLISACTIKKKLKKKTTSVFNVFSVLMVNQNYSTDHTNFTNCQWENIIKYSDTQEKGKEITSPMCEQKQFYQNKGKRSYFFGKLLLRWEINNKSNPQHVLRAKLKIKKSIKYWNLNQLLPDNYILEVMWGKH